MSRLKHLISSRVKWHVLAPSMTASVMLVAAALTPAAVAAPSAAQPREIARKDTLVISGFGPGLSEIQDP